MRAWTKHRLVYCSSPATGICLTVQLSGENKVMLKESREKASEVGKKNEKINSLHDITNAPDLQSELKL